MKAMFTVALGNGAILKTNFLSFERNALFWRQKNKKEERISQNFDNFEAYEAEFFLL
jgi:hypothetical protein